MSTLSAFRSVTVKFLRWNIWCSVHQLPPAIVPAKVPCLPPHRHFHVSHPRRAWVKNNQPSKPREEERKTKEARLKEIGLRDKYIPYTKVKVNSSRGLTEFLPLRDVLADVEERNKPSKRYYVELIANNPVPIVKILDLKEEYRKRKEAQEKAKKLAAQNVRKEVQLTWVSCGADIETKLERMKDDLERGFKVDLVITPKKGVRPPLHEGMKERAEEFASNFSGIAREWKERDYVKGTMVMYFQGTSRTEAEAEQITKIPKRQLLREQRKQKVGRRSKKQEPEVGSGNKPPAEYEVSP